MAADSKKPDQKSDSAKTSSKPGSGPASGTGSGRKPVTIDLEAREVPGAKSAAQKPATGGPAASTASSASKPGEAKTPETKPAETKPGAHPPRRRRNPHRAGRRFHVGCLHVWRGVPARVHRRGIAGQAGRLRLWRKPGVLPGIFPGIRFGKRDLT
jgi:hypothetical protein